MFRLIVDVALLRGMKQGLPGGHRVLETVEQSTPTERVGEIFRGNPVESVHPALQATVGGVAVLDVPDAIAIRTIVAGPEMARFDTQVCGHDPVAGIAVRPARDRSVSQCGAPRRRHRGAPQLIQDRVGNRTGGPRCLEARGRPLR